MLLNRDGLNDMMDRLGFTGTDLMEKQRAWMVSLGYTQPSIFDAQMAYLGDLGYTGTLQDRWAAYLIAGGYADLDDFYANYTVTTALATATFFANYSASTSFLYRDQVGTLGLVTTDGQTAQSLEDGNGNGIVCTINPIASGYTTTYKAGPPQSQYTTVVATSARVMPFYTSLGAGVPNTGGGTKQTSFFIGASGTTVIMAVKTDTLTDTTHQGWLGDGGANRFDIRNYQSAGLYYWRCTTFDGATKSVTIQGPGANVWHIVTVTHDGVTLRIRVNRSAWTTTAVGPLTNLVGQFQQSVCAALARGPYGYQGDWATWNSCLADGDIAAVEDVFATTYGVSLP